MADFDELLPEEADEQNQRLMHDLRRIYRTDTQTVEHLAHMRQRLLANDDSSIYDHESTQQHYTQPTLQQVQSSTRNAKQTRFAVVEEKSWQGRLGVLAAVLLTALLVGSLLLVLSLARRSNVGTPGNTPSKLAGGSDSLNSLHMIDPFTGWALSEHAVLRTTDGGLHWNYVTPPHTVLTGESIAEFLTASLAWVATPQANGTTAQVLRTTDGGQTWQLSTVQASFLRQITFIDSQHGWILSGWGATGGPAEAVSVFRTSDGGKTWRNVASALPASTDLPPPGHLPFGGQKSGIHFLNTSTGWITGTAVVNDLILLYASQDGGFTWYQQSLSLPPGVPPAQLSLLSPTFFSATDGILPVIFTDLISGRGIATDIYMTHDGGKTWKSTMPLAAAFGTIDFVDTQHGWATDGKILYSTSDGGQHWAKLSPGANFKQITYLSFVSSTTGWAIGKQSNTSSFLLKTIDGGKTWTPIPISISDRQHTSFTS
jgi:photosystem II stability/assembly factor-like uncharacterized protein